MLIAENVWITSVGTSAYAVVNPLWAACVFDEFIPVRFHFLVNQGTVKNADTAEGWIKHVLHEYEIKPQVIKHQIDEEDMDNFAKVLCKVIETEFGNSIAIDMTPGRKFMSACALLAGRKYEVEKLYYLHLYNSAYQDRPFILIPFNQQRLVNVIELI